MTFIEYCSQPTYKDSLYRIPINVVQELKSADFDTAFKTLAEEISKNYYERGWWDTTIMDKKFDLLNSIAKKYIKSMGRDY